MMPGHNADIRALGRDLHDRLGFGGKFPREYFR
jgi:hypothetical protein